MNQTTLPHEPLDFSKLTKKERSIAQAMTRGITLEEIAKEQFNSPHTVRNHAKAIFRKLALARGIREFLVRYWRDTPKPAAVETREQLPLFEKAS